MLIFRLLLTVPFIFSSLNFASKWYILLLARVKAYPSWMCSFLL
nr:MAG TPA: hypothetical protein [Caudoviricetes sp.]